jgi:hypothetical protein
MNKESHCVTSCVEHSQRPHSCTNHFRGKAHGCCHLGQAVFARKGSQSSLSDRAGKLAAFKRNGSISQWPRQKIVLVVLSKKQAGFISCWKSSHSCSPSYHSVPACRTVSMRPLIAPMPTSPPPHLTLQHPLPSGQSGLVSYGHLASYPSLRWTWVYAYTAHLPPESIQKPR